MVELPSSIVTNPFLDTWQEQVKSPILLQHFCCADAFSVIKPNYVTTFGKVVTLI